MSTLNLLFQNYMIEVVVRHKIVQESYSFGKSSNDDGLMRFIH